jgi:hypothetical protein
MITHLLHLHSPEPLVRIVWAVAVLLAGFVMLSQPEFGCGTYCRFDDREGFSAEQSSRLDRALSARRDAERPRYNWRKAVGILAVIAAMLELVPAIPYAIPYAALCLGLAASEMVCYVGMRRAAQRRAAALVRRSPLQTFPPLLMVAVAATFVGVLLVSATPALRAAGLVVAIATMILIWIAWQIAASRALLIGDDPKMEYAIDQRLRASRVANLIALACAPAVALVGSSLTFVPPGYQTINTAAFVLVYAAFVVVAIALVRTGRRSTAEFERAIA